MYISAEEMKSVLYEYQLDQITEDDADIVEQGIMAAESEVRSYFEAANARRESATLTAQQYAAWKLYDTNAIFGKTGTERNRFVMRLVMRVAAYNIAELANVDVINDDIEKRYEQTITTLEKIAGMGEYATSRLVIADLDSPAVDPDDGELSTKRPFRMISRRKFKHEED